MNTVYRAGKSQRNSVAGFGFSGAAARGTFAMQSEFSRRRKLRRSNGFDEPACTWSSRRRASPVRLRITVCRCALAKWNCSRVRWPQSWDLAARLRFLRAAEKWLEAVAKDLQSDTRRIAGCRRRTPASGSTRTGARDQRGARQCRHDALLHGAGGSRIPSTTSNRCANLCADIDAGKVDMLLILGGNPVYDAPHDFDFPSSIEKLKKVHTTFT